VIEVFPPKCRHCDSRLSRKMSTKSEVRRHQVTELPPIEALITEYRCLCLVCPDCGKATQAELPREAQGQFGPQLTALIAYLTVVCRTPRRMVRELLEQVLAIPLSLGSIQNSWEEVSEAVAEPCAELEEQLPHEPVVNSDETGYRTSGEKRWLWALVAANFVFFKIALTRGAEVLVELLGEVFAGILCSDRCASYLKYHKGEGQFCWAHFKRNILGVREIGKTTDAERFCRDALALHVRLFRLWHRFRDGPGVRVDLRGGSENSCAVNMLSESALSNHNSPSLTRMRQRISVSAGRSLRRIPRIPRLNDCEASSVEIACAQSTIREEQTAWRTLSNAAYVMSSVMSSNKISGLCDSNCFLRFSSPGQQSTKSNPGTFSRIRRNPSNRIWSSEQNSTVAIIVLSVADSDFLHSNWVCPGPP
jgi:hypothetical protein